MTDTALVSGWDDLHGPAEAVAPRLLGCELVRELDGQCLRGRIVETEAYEQADAASHSYRGRTPRTDVMFGPAGFLYVYFTYGMHYCCNVVTGAPGHGSAVLIRALEPLAGLEAMAAQRGLALDPADSAASLRRLTNGPAKLCQSLAIGKPMNGHNLRQPPLRLCMRPPVPATDIVQTTRIGINRAQDVPWRFYIAGNPFVSKPG